MLSGHPKYSWRVEAGKPGTGGSASPLVVGYEGIERVLTPGPAYRIGRDPKGDIPITDDTAVEPVDRMTSLRASIVSFISTQVSRL